MGKYKNLKIDLDENKLDIIDIILITFLIASLLFTVYLVNESEKLLNQLDVAMGKYNEVNYQYELLNNEYEELKNDYEYVVDFIRTSNKYQLPEEMEESK